MGGEEGPTIREAMKRQEGQDERHHRAFLLWAMLAPEHRSWRAVSAALKCSDNSVKKWHGREGWADRIGDPEVCRHAADAYAALYHSRLGGREVEVIKERLGVPYDGPPVEAKTQLARSVDLYDQVDREQALQLYQSDARQRNEALKGVLDATLSKVQREIVDGKLVPKISDLSTVLRGFELVDKSEVRRLQMLPSGEDADGVAGGRDVLAMSQRVQQARQKGGDILPALEEDLEELLLIVRTMRSHEDVSNVVTFPRRQEKASG